MIVLRAAETESGMVVFIPEAIAVSGGGEGQDMADMLAEWVRVENVAITEDAFVRAWVKAYASSEV